MHELLANPTVHVYAVCAAILVLKMIALGTATGLTRIMTGTYISPEDYAFVGGRTKPVNETIERMRRAHLNDLENIPGFLVVGLLYALAGPSYAMAWWIFVLFTAGRVLHTLVYVAGLQPWRSIFFELANLSAIVATVHLLILLL